jgi:hypothetical protein
MDLNGDKSHFSISVSVEDWSHRQHMSPESSSEIIAFVENVLASIQSTAEAVMRPLLGH